MFLPKFQKFCFLLALPMTNPTADAALLFYEGFATEDYAVGEINGQAFVGDGYETGGSWNTTSTFVEGGLTYPGIPTTDGFHLSRSAGEVQAPLNLSSEGPFGAAGLVSQTNNKIGGEGITASLYFSVLARKDVAGNGFAGFQIYDGGTEGFGGGQVTGGNAGAFKWLQGGSNAPIGDPFTQWVVGETTLFVFKMDFDETEPNVGTIWLNPDPTLGEGEQATENISVVQNAGPPEGFNTLRMRGNAIWSYDEIRIGTTWDDVLGVTVIDTPLQITELLFSRETQIVSLTWDSVASATYSVKYSTDLQDWSNNLDPGVDADTGNSTTAEFDLNDFGLADSDVLFFRIERN